MPLKLINSFLKKYFDQDPEVAGRLQSLQGKHVILSLTDLNKELLVTSEQERIVVAEHLDYDSCEVDATVHTDVMTLLCIALGAKYQPHLEDGSVHVQGDLEVAKQMGRILASVEIDWEEIAAFYVGDTLAHQFGMLLGRAGKYKRRSIKNFFLDVSEYLQEESQVMPAKAEIVRFLSETETLDADIGHLEDRIDRLGKTKR